MQAVSVCGPAERKSGIALIGDFGPLKASVTPKEGWVSEGHSLCSETPTVTCESGFPEGL